MFRFFFIILKIIISLHHDNNFFAQTINPFNPNNRSPMWAEGTLTNNTPERKHRLGINGLLFRDEHGMHGLSYNMHYADLGYSILRKRYSNTQFHSSSLSYGYITKKKHDAELPWMVSFGNYTYGTEWGGNDLNNIMFLASAGVKTKGGDWNYGLMYTDQGAFRGIPFPFFVYSFKLHGHKLRVGLPTFSASGPDDWTYNYDFNLSLSGLKIHATYIKENLGKFFAGYEYTVEAYRLQHKRIDEQEAILIDKHILASGLSVQHAKNIRLDYSLGTELNRHVWEGQNIFSEHRAKHDIPNNQFIKAVFVFTI